MQLKAKIRNLATEKNISPQLVLQNYMLERFLKRISLSKFRDNFIIKGGLLISSMIGIDSRTTMDIDTTIKSLPLSEGSIRELFTEICTISADDDISFVVKQIEPIRGNDEYGGYRVHLLAGYDPMSVSIKADVTAGDIITPKEIDYSYMPMFSDELIQIKSYNLETLLAEKLETIISRSVLNTRPRDFYDIYILRRFFSDRIDYNLLTEALRATAKKRGSISAIENHEAILLAIETDENMQNRWDGYSKTYSYSKGIGFTKAIEAVRDLLIRSHAESL